ncbi:MAG: MFS transporter [Deltaproteobacteria bacterium]|nr:MFS transporter [Deltaproteobacteria bacterium]
MEKKLSGLLVHSYGFSHLTFSLMMSLALQYYTIFLTDVALIKLSIIPVIYFITHIVDAISIPVSGVLIQSTQFRWGQYRSWLLFPPLATSVFFTLTFTNLPLSYGIKIVYLGFAYMIAHVSLNFAYNAQLGLISVVAKSVKDRMRMSTRNVQYGMSSQIIYSYLVLSMFYHFSSKNESWGYFYTVGILAVIQVLGYWFLFYQIKDYDKYDPAKILSTRMSLKEMVQQVIGNRHLRNLMSADIVSYLGIFSLQQVAVYYFKYVIENEQYMKPYSLSLAIASFASTLIAPYVVRILGKKNTYLFATIWGTAGYIALRMFGLSGPYVYIAIIVVSALGAGVNGPIRQAMYMDTAEYGYYKSGKDASAFIMSMFTLPIKIAIAIAGTIVLAGLDFIGYVPNIVPTEQFINSLMNLICYLPAGACLLAFVIMSFYSLSDNKVTEIMEINSAKRAEAR